MNYISYFLKVGNCVVQVFVHIAKTPSAYLSIYQDFAHIAKTLSAY